MSDVALLGGQRIAVANYDVTIDDQGAATGDYVGSDGFNRAEGSTVTLGGPNYVSIILTLSRDVNVDDCAIIAIGKVRDDGGGGFYHVDASARAVGAAGTSSHQIQITLFNPPAFPATEVVLGFYITVFRLNRG